MSKFTITIVSDDLTKEELTDVVYDAIQDMNIYKDVSFTMVTKEDN